MSKSDSNASSGLNDGNFDKVQKKVFEIFDRLDEIKDALENKFPSYDFIYRVRYFKDSFGLVMTELNEFFKESTSIPSQEEVRAIYPKVRRNVLFYFLLSEMFFEHFENDQELHKKIQFVEPLKKMLQEQKTLGEISIALAFRRVLAHIRPFDDESLMYEAAVLGAGNFRVKFRYDIATSDWEKLNRYINSPRFNEPFKSNALKLLEKVKYQIYNPETKENEIRYQFMPLVHEGLTSFLKLFDSMEQMYNDHHIEDNAQRQAFAKEEQELEEWLRSVDVGAPV